MKDSAKIDEIKNIYNKLQAEWDAIVEQKEKLQKVLEETYSVVPKVEMIEAM